MAQVVCCRSGVTAVAGRRARLTPRCDATKKCVVTEGSAAGKRRALLLSVVGIGIGAASSAKRALALTSIPLYDDRKTQDFMLSVDSMRDSELPLKQRNYFQGDTALLSDAEHKSRLAKAKGRLSIVKGHVEAGRWNLAYQEIGQGLGTARYDLDALTAKVSDRSARKRAQRLQDTAMRDIEALSVAVRRQKKDQAMNEFAKASKTLSEAIGVVG